MAELVMQQRMELLADDPSGDWSKPPFDILPPGLGGWCIVANIKDHARNGLDPGKSFYGTRAFAPKAKVIVVWCAWSQLAVLGQNRGGKGKAISIVSTKLLTNLRAKIIYNPADLQRLLNYAPPRELAFRDPQKPNNHGAGYFTLFASKALCEQHMADLDDWM